MTTTTGAIRRLELLLARTPDMECADDLRFLLADYTLVIANYKTVCLNNEDLTQKLAEARRLLDDARALVRDSCPFVPQWATVLQKRYASFLADSAAPVPAQPACQGKNCGSMDGLTHSDECYAEAAETFSGKKPAAVPEAVAKVPDSFVEYMSRNYPAGTVIADAGWHARPIWHAACHALQNAALLSAADTEVKNG